MLAEAVEAIDATPLPQSKVPELLVEKVGQFRLCGFCKGWGLASERRQSLEFFEQPGADFIVGLAALAGNESLIPQRTVFA